MKEEAVLVENVAVRHKAIDDVILRECVPKEGGIKQVVVLNSGMDTRPYRLTLPDVKWFEVDSFEVLELKRRLLQTAPADLELYASKRVGQGQLVAHPPQLTVTSLDSSVSCLTTTSCLTCLKLFINHLV